MDQLHEEGDRYQIHGLSSYHRYGEPELGQAYSTHTSSIAVSGLPSHASCNRGEESPQPTNICNHQAYSTESSSLLSENVTLWEQRRNLAGTQANVNQNAVVAQRIYPFVCGLCYFKFDCIVNYFAHITKHSSILDINFHLCNKLKDYEESHDIIENWYKCSKCKFACPTLCLLNKHLMEVEHVQCYRLNVVTKTADLLHQKDVDAVCEINLIKSEKLCFTPSANEIMLEHNEDVAGDAKATDVDEVNQELSQNCTIPDEIHLQPTHGEDTTNAVESQHCCKNSPDVNDPIRDSGDSDAMRTMYDSICDRNNAKKGSISTDLVHSCTKPCKRKKDSHRQIKKTNVEKLKRSTRNPKLEKSVALKGKQKLMRDESGKPVYANNTYLPCDKCGTIVQRSKISVHMICHRETRDFPCGKCDYQAKSSFSLKQHMRMVHPPENNFTCQTCGKSFKNNLYLKQHTNTHSEKDKQCPICPQAFTTVALLRRHMLVHKDEKLYKCQQCDKQFTFKGNLNSHMRTVHSDQRNFACPQCGKTFKIMHALKKHIKTHEPHQYFCNYCDRSFVTAFNMKVHMKTHD